jgi:hypothetical protein
VTLRWVKSVGLGGSLVEGRWNQNLKKIQKKRRKISLLIDDLSS